MLSVIRVLTNSLLLLWLFTYCIQNCKFTRPNVWSSLCWIVVQWPCRHLPLPTDFVFSIKWPSFFTMYPFYIAMCSVSWQTSRHKRPPNLKLSCLHSIEKNLLENPELVHAEKKFCVFHHKLIVTFQRTHLLFDPELHIQSTFTHISVPDRVKFSTVMWAALFPEVFMILFTYFSLFMCILYVQSIRSSLI